ncbi:MAG: hypothetical protein V1773_12555 [bacterium]
MVLNFAIIDIIKETKNTTSLILKEITNQINNFYAGQYLTFLINEENSIVKRSYSISSSPLVLPLIRITIKKNQNFPSYTNFVDYLKIGDILVSEPVNGNFYVDPFITNNNNYLFISGGSGITPPFSMISTILETEINSQVILLNQNRNENSIIFYNELKKLSIKFIDNFKLINILSKPIEKWDGLAGRITFELLEKFYLENRQFINNCDIYVCGPGGLIDTVYNVFNYYEVDNYRIHKEVYNLKKTTVI